MIYGQHLPFMGRSGRASINMDDIDTDDQNVSETDNDLREINDGFVSESVHNDEPSFETRFPIPTMKQTLCVVFATVLVGCYHVSGDRNYTRQLMKTVECGVTADNKKKGKCQCGKNTLCPEYSTCNVNDKKKNIYECVPTPQCTGDARNCVCSGELCSGVEICEVNKCIQKQCTEDKETHCLCGIKKEVCANLSCNKGECFSYPYDQVCNVKKKTCE